MTSPTMTAGKNKFIAVASADTALLTLVSRSTLACVAGMK